MKEIINTLIEITKQIPEFIIETLEKTTLNLQIVDMPLDEKEIWLW